MDELKPVDSSQKEKPSSSYIWIPIIGVLSGIIIGWAVLPMILGMIGSTRSTDGVMGFFTALAILGASILICAFLGFFGGLQIRWNLLHRHLPKASRPPSKYWIVILGSIIGFVIGYPFFQLITGIFLGTLAGFLVRKRLNDRIANQRP